MKRLIGKQCAMFIAGVIFLGSALTCAAQQWTPEQRAQAQEIFDRNYANMNNIRQELAAKRYELDAQLASPNPDSAKIESLSREIGELRGKMLANRSKVRNQLRDQGLSSDYYGDSNNGNWHHGRPYGNWHHGDRRGGYGPWEDCGCW